MLFTCPSRYSFTIGHTRVFSLGGWSPQLHARLLGSGVTQELHYDRMRVSRTGLSPSLAPRSRGLLLPLPAASVGPTTPQRPKAPRFGLFPVRSPLLRESRLISLPPGTEMFQFPGFASRRSEMTAHMRRRVSPFGHPRITACVPLPLAYRSLPRPSSPSCAQASPTCFRSLDHKIVVKQSTRDLLLISSETARAAANAVAPKGPAVSRLHCHFSCRFVIPRSLLRSVVKQRRLTSSAVWQPSRDRNTCGRATSEDFPRPAEARASPRIAYSSLR